MFKKLANKTASWLAEKRTSGFDNLLSEGLLIISVVEFLIGQGYTDFEAELDAYPLFGLNGRGAYAAYDLTAKHKLKNVILEKKLNPENNQRIIKDFVKLAVPPHAPDYDRLFLLSRVNVDLPTIINKIIGKQKCHFALLTPNAPEVLLNGSQQSLSGREQESVLKMMKADPNLLEFTVEVAANETQGSDNVIILSVDRI